MDSYAHAPHIHHEQTFFLAPAPFLAPLTRHVPAPALVLDVGHGWDMCWGIAWHEKPMVQEQA